MLQKMQFSRRPSGSGDGCRPCAASRSTISPTTLECGTGGKDTVRAAVRWDRRRAGRGPRTSAPPDRRARQRVVIDRPRRRHAVGVLHLLKSSGRSQYITVPQNFVLPPTQ